MNSGVWTFRMTGWPSNPARGGLSIAPAQPHPPLFLFFSGAAPARLSNCPPAAPLKNKKNGGWSNAPYKQATPDGVSCRGLDICARVIPGRGSRGLEVHGYPQAPLRGAGPPSPLKSLDGPALQRREGQFDVPPVPKERLNAPLRDTAWHRTYIAGIGVEPGVGPEEPQKMRARSGASGDSGPLSQPSSPTLSENGQCDRGCDKGCDKVLRSPTGASRQYPEPRPGRLDNCAHICDRLHCSNLTGRSNNRGAARPGFADIRLCNISATQ